MPIKLNYTEKKWTDLLDDDRWVSFPDADQYAGQRLDRASICPLGCPNKQDAGNYYHDYISAIS